MYSFAKKLCGSYIFTKLRGKCKIKIKIHEEDPFRTSKD
jgi:hypothetical protein